MSEQAYLKNLHGQGLDIAASASGRVVGRVYWDAQDPLIGYVVVWYDDEGIFEEFPNYPADVVDAIAARGYDLGEWEVARISILAPLEREDS